MKDNKKGQANAAVMGAVGTLLLLVLLGLTLTLTSEVNENLADSQGRSLCTNGFWNSSVLQCQATAGNVTVVNTSVSVNSTLGVLDGQDEFAGQLPTVFLLAAVGLLLAFLVGTLALNRLT